MDKKSSQHSIPANKSTVKAAGKTLRYPWAWGVRQFSAVARASPVVFKFKRRALMPIAGILFSAILASFIYYIEQHRHGPRSPVEILPFVFIAIFLSCTIAGLRQKSDILVDDQSISRRLLGWRWQTIAWGNIQKIKVIPFFDPSLRKFVRIISIRPAIKPEFGLQLHRMSFDDQAENMNELLAILNRNIALHNIPVEASKNGKKFSIPSL